MTLGNIYSQETPISFFGREQQYIWILFRHDRWNILPNRYCIRRLWTLVCKTSAVVRILIPKDYRMLEWRIIPSPPSFQVWLDDSF